MLILYTENQLKEAYLEFKDNIANSTPLQVPTLEEFRVIFEEEHVQQYFDTLESDGRRKK
jgi:hypothetical protein|tara:strand:+ start:130 stop:309 length:180 start_codon:yes stop_codon:yes gene_type:complete